MKLGTGVGLVPGDIVLDEDPASPSPLEKGNGPLLLGPCLLWPWSPISATAELLLQLLFYLCVLPCTKLRFANCTINLYDNDTERPPSFTTLWSS